jgi:hypothetical protein
MGTEDFAEFVARQQGTDVETEVDWAGVRDEWLKDLDTLHKQIQGFLKEYVPHSISYTFTKIELTEPDIGRYLAKRMDIKIGRQQVSLVPVGTLLVGAKGRVDVVGITGRAQILLVDKRAKSPADLIRVTVNFKGSVAASRPAPPQPMSWAWKILTNTAERRFKDLDKKNFFDLLMEIANA